MSFQEGWGKFQGILVPKPTKPDVEADGDDQEYIPAGGRQPYPTLGSCLRIAGPEEDSPAN